ncbi:alternative ribosome rescue aminoacyl-tRNA hydrolase ArfB [Salibacter halophilus]|uniref:Aminoacyl-tRNA hydrolase n=1 Tax=Salibacter halophilus TaxID=1803916 RepID=A0A6N6M8N9_9FLAO|nr:alternative ribosome rescue aminoacyl-tRNA hydrolase ArfB [Salibacter halophilus]KAB1065235.1 aminoacyl-tRNA hydrolase [Salibacter halophilus]
MTDGFKNIILTELRTQTSRSSGKGGQHVNKTETKVELFWNIEESSGVTSQQKKRLFEKLKNKINADGELHITCEETRSQIKNREIAEKKLWDTIQEALKKSKRRIKTKPTKASQKKRVDDNKKKGQIKKLRKNPLD